MSDYWKNRVKSGKVWGNKPSDTTYIASEYYRKFHKNNLLVIGSGYGRTQIISMIKALKLKVLNTQRMPLILHEAIMPQ